MNNARIDFVKAATLSVAAAAVPFSAAAYMAQQQPRLAFLFPLVHATGLQSAHVISTSVQNVSTTLSGITGAPRFVTAKEDRWLRRAAVRSSKLVGRGKLLTLNA